MRTKNGDTHTKYRIEKTFHIHIDLKDIRNCYQKDGGEFWIAIKNGEVIGTIGLMIKEDNWAVMKKFL